MFVCNFKIYISEISEIYFGHLAKEENLNRDSLKVNHILSPIQKSPVQRNSKHSGSSTRNTNLLDSKIFTSPYMQQVVNRNLSPIHNVAIDNGKIKTGDFC